LCGIKDGCCLGRCWKCGTGPEKTRICMTKMQGWKKCRTEIWGTKFAEMENIGPAWLTDWQTYRRSRYGINEIVDRKKPHLIMHSIRHMFYYNPLGNLNSGRRPWAKPIRSASLQRVLDAAIAKLLCRLVSRCFYMSICVCFYDNVELRRMRCISTKQSPDGYTEMSLTVMYAVCRLLDKLHICSNILCTCNIFIKMWAQI